jgi:predicted histidine transporter YuiF (NhaC family)
MIYKTVMLIVIIALGIGLFGNVFYKANKITKYKNDERWQLIQNKANKATVWYHSLLIVVLAITMTLDVFYLYDINFNLSQITQYAFIVLLLQYTIELIYLVYLDKKL